MKKFAIATGALVATSAMILGATPAFATIDPWNSGIIKGDVAVDLGDDGTELSHVYGWDSVGASTVGTTTTHSAGALFLSDGTNDWYPWCDTTTAVVSDDNGASVVSCDAQTPVDGSDNAILQGIEVTPSFRISAADANGIVLGRISYAVTNTTGADITIPKMEVGFSWDEYSYGLAPTNLGDGTVNDDLTGTGALWVNTAYFNSDDVTISPDSTTYGAAWAGANGTVFKNIEGAVTDDYLFATETNYVVPAGKTVYFAFYGVYAYIANLTGLAEDEFDGTTTFMGVFDGAYEGELTAGLPADAYVVNWQPAPTLPDTGAADMTGFAAGAVAVSLIGLALVAMRRRNA